MRLPKECIGNLVNVVDERNSENLINDFFGININKEFMPTVANVDEVDPKKYKILRHGIFVFSGMQTGRDECIRIGLFNNDNPVLISPAYTTFEILDKEKIIPEYFFMLFLRGEMDRYGWFLSDGSVRANLDWERFCEIEFQLPSVKIQQKYVDIYNAMCRNQKAYENGLEDLKLTCEAFIEKLRREEPLKAIGDYVEASGERNEKGQIKLAQGVNVDKQFITAKRVADDVESSRIVRDGQFAYNKVMKADGTKLPIALRAGEPCCVSGSYQVFYVSKCDELISEYLMMWLERRETQRFAGFISWGSTRDVLQFETLGEIQIPIPDIKIQQSIVNIYNTYIIRRKINDRLKAQIKSICPILIKGAMEESLRSK